VIFVQKTVKALADLRTHWRAEGCPSVSKIAKTANVPNATANRYLTGVTKGGAPETIRALAIAMDRRDIADSIPFTSVADTDHTEDYITEMIQQWHETSQQQMAEAAARHKQELEALMRDHRLERDDWHAQRKAMHEENVNLRASFDAAVTFRDAQLRAARVEKWICFALLVASVVFALFK
jgi:hypothetical protein